MHNIETTFTLFRFTVMHCWDYIIKIYAIYVQKEMIQSDDYILAKTSQLRPNKTKHS